jgi:predicted DNA-binding transcriptional regulator AlpA
VVPREPGMATSASGDCRRMFWAAIGTCADATCGGVIAVRSAARCRAANLFRRGGFAAPVRREASAERLTVSVGCIRAWRLRGEGPPAIRVGTALRWDANEVADWLDARRESSLAAG